MDSAVSTMSCADSPLTARHTLGIRIGKKRGARVEDEAKAICFQRRRDITGVYVRMQLLRIASTPGNTFAALLYKGPKHPRNLDPIPHACYFLAVTLVLRKR